MLVSGPPNEKPRDGVNHRGAKHRTVAHPTPQREHGPPFGRRQGPAVSLLSLAKRTEVIAHLAEGAGIRPTSRLCDVSQPTILSLLLRVGTGCDRLHDRLVRDLDIRDIQCDEIWSFIQKKQARVTPQDNPEHGDAFSFLAIARTQKIVIAYRVGKRDQANTDAFMVDLRSRVTTVPQISADGFGPYRTAVGQNFEAVDFGVVHKDYSRSPRRVRDGLKTDYRYEPPRDPFITRIPVYGNPDPGRISTSHIERLNLEVRMQTRRMTRLCNGFSRSLTHHSAAVSLFVAHTNFCKIHGALRVTPAMEAGITDHVWSVEELVARALDAAVEPVAKPVKRPLRMPGETPSVPAVAVRELPGGRGFLRVVQGGQAPAPKPPPVLPPTPLAAALAAPRQLSLFSKRDDEQPQF